MTNPVSTMRRGAVLEVTLDRPKANAINPETSRYMDDVFQAFAADSELRVAILTGAGDKFFSAGWDLVEAAGGDSEGGFGKGGFGGLTQFFDLDKPIIAAINGYAAGGGFELALACDHRLAAENAVLALPEAQHGLMPGCGGTVRLSRLVGRRRALQLIMSGRSIMAPEAFDLGLVDAIHPRKELVAAAEEMALP